MSEFRSMTLVVQSPKTFIEPVKLSPLKNLWHRVTGKDIPTMEFPHLHTIVLDDSHDVSTVESVIGRMIMADYELVSVIIDGWDFEAEMQKHVEYLSNIPAFFEALMDDTYQVDFIWPFITMEDCADVLSWTDRVFFSGTCYEDVVRQWAESFHRVYEETAGHYAFSSNFVATDSLPSWMDLDWEKTLSNIARECDSYVVEFADCVHYFSNN